MEGKLRDKQTSVPRQIREITEMWIKDFSVDYFRKFSDSMPDRLQLIITRKGHMTQY